jgi:hypothetical protein
VEALKDPEEFVGIAHIKPSSIVLYGKAIFIGALRAGYRDLRAFPSPRIFYRIRNQVRPNLFEEGPIYIYGWQLTDVPIDFALMGVLKNIFKDLGNKQIHIKTPNNKKKKKKIKKKQK